MNIKNKWMKGTALSLAAVTTLGIGIMGYSGKHVTQAEETGTTEQLKTVTEQVAASGTEKSQNDGELFKEETVYVNADAQGVTQNITVTDWLKNAGNQGDLKDQSDLTNIQNVKGDETFAQDGSAVTWQTKDADITYQGTSDKTLPVTLRVAYKLDGKAVSPKELVGKSGKVTMTYTYNNTLKSGDVFTPFTVVTGMFLPSDTFSNVTIDNGKILSDGNKIIAVGVALPGLESSLNLGSDVDLKLPESVTVTADAKDFEMGPTITMVSSDLVSQFDLEDVDSFDELSDSLTALGDASTQLVEGSGTLSDGVNTLNEKSGTLASGILTLNDGIQRLAQSSPTLAAGINAYTSGTDTLADGATKYVDGANTLASGAADYVAGATTLADGSTQYADGTTTLADGVTDYTKGEAQVADGIDQLTEATKDLPSSVSGLSAGLTTARKGADQLAEGGAALSAGSTQIAEGTTGINEALLQIQAQLAAQKTPDLTMLTSALQASMTSEQSAVETLNAVSTTLETAGDQTTKASVDQAVGTLETSLAYQKQVVDAIAAYGDSGDLSGLKTAIDQLVDKSGELATGAGTLNSGINGTEEQPGYVKSIDGLAAGLDTLDDGGKKLAGAANGLGTALGDLKAGSDTLSENNATLTQGAAALKEKGNTLKQGAAALTSNNDKLTKGAAALENAGGELVSGASQLTANSSTLKSGAAALTEGTNQLSAGGNQLAEGAGTLTSGVKQLADGALTLKNGMSKFDEEGIKKLTQAFDGDISGITDRIKAIKDAGDAYQSFTGKDSSMKGNVKFIIETTSIQEEQ